jgi:hypothetical protein
VGLGGAGFFSLAWVTDGVGSGSGRVGLWMVGSGIESVSMEWLREVKVDQCLAKAVMSTPDTLPMEMALIVLPLFKFQVYSTPLHHYYHRPITLSTFQLPYQPTIDHMALINTLRLPLKKFFCPQDWCLTHTQYSLTQPQLPRVQLQHLPSTSISFPELIFAPIVCIKSHGTHLQQYCGHH